MFFRGVLLGVPVLGDFELVVLRLCDRGATILCEMLLAEPSMFVELDMLRDWLEVGVACKGPTPFSSPSRDLSTSDLVPLETWLSFGDCRLRAELASLRALVLDLGVVLLVDFFFSEMRFFSGVLLRGLLVVAPVARKGSAVLLAARLLAMVR